MAKANRRLMMTLFRILLLIAVCFAVFSLLYTPNLNKPFISKDVFPRIWTDNTVNLKEYAWNSKKDNGASKDYTRDSKEATTDVKLRQVVYPDIGPPYNRVDDAAENTEALPFLSNFRNPCWLESTSANNSRIRCLPSFYAIGVPLCGTTDLHRRLTKHPQISSNVQRDIQWINTLRNKDPDSINLSTYLKFFDEAISTDILPSGQNGYHDAIIGDFSTNTLTDNSYYLTRADTKFHVNAELLRHLNPDTKILVTICNPVTRAYTSFKHHYRNTSPELFHTEVERTIDLFDKTCCKCDDMLKCIQTFPRHVMHDMLIGIYAYIIPPFLRLFPREQVHITTMEARSKNMASALKNIFSFLGVDALPDSVMDDIASPDLTAREPDTGPEMLDETRTLLEDFFTQFNIRLGNIIGQEFNFNNDHTHV